MVLLPAPGCPAMSLGAPAAAIPPMPADAGSAPLPASEDPPVPPGIAAVPPCAELPPFVAGSPACVASPPLVMLLGAPPKPSGILLRSTSVMRVQLAATKSTPHEAKSKGFSKRINLSTFASVLRFRHFSSGKHGSASKTTRRGQFAYFGAAPSVQ
jgi:hypothetical protein